MVITYVGFTPVWANPFWECAEFAPSMMPERILAGVTTVINRLGEVDKAEMEISDESVKTDPLPLLAPAPPAWRAKFW